MMTVALGARLGLLFGPSSNSGRGCRKEESHHMTLEELEFLQRHPGVPEALVPAFLANLKRQRAMKERAKCAARHGGEAVAPDREEEE